MKKIFNQNWFKQLFHKHIWKEESKEFLREERLPFGAEGHITTYAQYKFYGIEYKCTECGKTKIIEKRTVVI
jgi:hypothetical protein